MQMWETFLNLRKLVIGECITAILLFASLCDAKEIPPPKSEAPKVVILSKALCCVETAWPKAETAVVDELKTVISPVHVVQGTFISPEELKATLIDIAQANHTNVVVHLHREESNVYRADILTIRSNNNAHIQHLYFNAEIYSDDLHAATLKIVETVRAHLKKTASPSQSPTTSADPNEVQPKEPTSYRLGVGVGVATAWSPGGVKPSVGIGADIHVTLGSFLLLELNAKWDLYIKEIENADASANFRTAVVRGSLYWNILPSGKIHPALGLGAGVLLAQSAGRSDPTIVDNFNEKSTLAYLGAAGRLAFDISSHGAFVLNGKCGILLPELYIHLQDHPATSYGRPILELLGTFEFRFL